MSDKKKGPIQLIPPGEDNDDDDDDLPPETSTKLIKLESALGIKKDETLTSCISAAPFTIQITTFEAPNTTSVEAKKRGQDTLSVPGAIEMAPIPQMPGLLTYRSVRGEKRKTIGQLLYGADVGNDDDEDEGKIKPDSNQIPDGDSKRNFGMWDGVFARCLLNIFGVIMFLRLGYVVGLAGIIMSIVIMLVSIVITLATTLSLSAICTNGEVQGGGAYFMISRSLGPSFGGSIGILFSVANAISVALYILGFAESLVDGVLTDAGFMLIDGAKNDQIIWSLITLVIILIMCIIGVGWVIKIQLLLLVVLVVCIICVIGGILQKPPNPAFNITGISSNTTNLNLWEDYTLDPKISGGGFFYAFSIFFPAVTGIMAGANISGEIKKPEFSIPYGTLLAVGVSGVVYIILGYLMGASVERNTLVNEKLIMKDLSWVEIIIHAGVWAATISSAIASFVGAPRILQAVARDHLFPKLEFFSVEWNNEPLRGYVLTFVIAAVCILGGDLDLIAPLITGFFMISYAFVNFACFAGSYANLPGWRPSFKYYNKWLALATALICVAILFLLNPWYGLATSVLSIAIYKYLDFRDPDVNWGSAVDATKYKMAVHNINSLERVRYHIKNYKPQLLVLTGEVKKAEETERIDLIIFSQQLRKAKGAYIYGNVILSENMDNIKDPKLRDAQKKLLKARGRSPLKEFGIPVKNGFSETVVAENLRYGVLALLQMSGISKIRPNILLMGYKESWIEASTKDVEDYVDIIRDAFFFNYGVCIARKYREINKEISSSNKFHTGNLDVWWLFDDGGLTALIPHLLHLNAVWEKTDLRFFVLSSNDEMQQVQKYTEINGLLKSLRMEPQSLEAIPVDMEDDIDEKFMKHYLELKSKNNPTSEMKGDTTKLSSRARRHLKVAELIAKKSSDSKFVVLTMPIPEVGLEAKEYMRWLDCLTFQLPSVCLIRGNQETVLTFEM